MRLVASCVPTLKLRKLAFGQTLSHTCILSSDICLSPKLGGRNFNEAPLTMRSSFIVKPLSFIVKSVGSKRSRNPDSQVMCWSDALAPHAFERKLIIPLFFFKFIYLFIIYCKTTYKDIQYTTLLALLALLTTQYYITFPFTFAHTLNEKKK